jgi:tRNA-specific 2-thiouridylase
MTKKVLVGMSGGVDSSSVVAKLLKDGYDVEGVTLNYGKFCEKSDIEDSKKVAEQLKIKHYIVNCESNYEEKVVKYFANEYVNGNTPNPCVSCNKNIKFPLLLEAREKWNADLLATGHYVNVLKYEDFYYLEKGIDPRKDQSYFLGQIKYEYLQYLIFPLGNLKKEETRKFAKSINLVVADKPESQDMCLARGKDYREILRNYYEPKKGDIIHVDGRKIGEHNGITDYTQGQRKGLGIGGTAEPLFVIRIDPKENIIYVGSESDLFKTEIKIDKVNFLNLTTEFNKKYEVEVKLRSTNKADKADAVFFKDKTANVFLKEPSRNISKGQLCVIYIENRVIASGFIL